MTVGQAVSLARTRLAEAGIPGHEAALDAELLLRHAARWDRATFLVNVREPLAFTLEREYGRLIDRRCTRVPVAYIRGVQEFWGREFLVSRSVLIPRPETELIVEEALPYAAQRLPTCRHRSEPLRIVDVGTGSGCLAITLVNACPRALVIALDVSRAALSLAVRNAARFDTGGRLAFVQADGLTAVGGPAHIIVANPPYVAESDAADLAPEVRDFEPPLALFGGSDGLRLIRTLVDDVAPRLVHGGVLIMEIGTGQLEAVRQLVAETHALAVAKVRADLQGIPRVVVITRERE